ncbi:MAG: ferritin-like domain-containing protein [Planctomycetota bacterium]|jgi:bacterioferritin
MDKQKREQAKKNVIVVLNKARSMELHAISQYMNQHYNLDDKDYGDLAAKVKLIAIDEMRHAEMFAERIKELDGEPTADLAAKVQKGQAIEKVFPFDANQEDNTIAEYNTFLKVCQENGDSVSAKLFEAIIDEEQIHYNYLAIIDEEQIHYNYFDNVTGHIEELGQTYLAQIAGTPSATGLGTQGFVAQEEGA